MVAFARGAREPRTAADMIVARALASVARPRRKVR
jgi:hypothetical protein